MNARAGQSCLWPDLALLGVAINLVVLILAPIVRPDLDILERSLSYYAVGPWAFLQTLAFIGMGIASIAAAIGLMQARIRSPWLPVSALSLLISGIASFGLVVFPVESAGPTTFIGDTHQSAGTIGGVAQLVAALALAVAAHQDERWSGLVVPAVIALLLASAGALSTQLSIWWPELGIPRGVSMRLMVVPLVLLWGAVALRLRQACAA